MWFEAKIEVKEVQTWRVEAKTKKEAVLLFEWGDSRDIHKLEGDAVSFEIISGPRRIKSGE